jgi:hypothetical protein
LYVTPSGAINNGDLNVYYSYWHTNASTIALYIGTVGYASIIGGSYITGGNSNAIYIDNTAITANKFKIENAYIESVGTLTTPISITVQSTTTTIPNINGCVIGGTISNVKIKSTNIFSNIIQSGTLRTISIPITKTGSTLTTITGTFTESPAILKPGANTLHCTANGTANIVIPTGCTGTVASVGGGATVATSPVTLAAGTTLITVTAGGTNEFTVTINAFAFALQCPELQNCLITKVEVDITTAGGTATSTLKIGMGDTATDTSAGSEFFTAIDVNAIALRDSYLAGDTGAQTKYIPWNYTGTDDYLIGLFETEIANNIVGNILITYMGR